MRTILFLFFLFLCDRLHAQGFEAFWIATTDAKTTPNTWYCYRKSFDIKEIPKNLKAKIAVDTKYWLWINGKLVVYEGGLKRGPNARDTYYDEVALSEHLRKGKNTIALLVWFWGGKGLSHNNSGQSALLFDCIANDFQLLSNGSWKAIRYEAYMPSTAPKPNFRLSEPNILYDAQKEIQNWYSLSYEDGSWPSAIELGKAGMAPWNRLIKRNIPFFKFDTLKAYVKTEKFGDTIVCQLPYNGQFSAYLKVRSKRGQKIFMGSDTYFLGAYPGDTLYTLCSEYLTTDGVQEYESLGWLSGHKMRYILPKDVELISVKYRETGYDAGFAGSFDCSDPFLNTLWKKAQRTLYVNMRDNYMDCPDRERAQWAGDAAMEMAQAFYALDRRSDDLSRKLYLDLINWQRPDSTIYNPVPETAWKIELPAHSLMPLSEIWRYFIHTKDTATLRIAYPAIKKYLAIWKLQPNGQLIYREGGWNWGDWGDHKDLVLIQHAWYLLTMQTAVKIASVIGEKDDNYQHQARIDSIKIFLNSADCWNGTAYRHKDYKEATDERVNALMVIATVADSSKWDKLTDVFLKEEHASPWMEKFVLEALIKMRKPELALQRMKKRYKEMVESRISTLWELWKYREEEVHGNSGYNHGWAGGPLVLLSQYYAGISPDETTENGFIIKPMLAGLKWIDASVSTTNGLLHVSIKEESKSLLLSCSVPKGLSVKLGLPKKGSNYKKITSDGKELSTARSIKGEDKDYVWIEVGAGSYHFSINY